MAGDLLKPQRAACTCGGCSFDIGRTPIIRFICHCTICQAFNKKPFADVTVMRAHSVKSEDPQNIAFRRHRSPPNIERGACRICGNPAIEYGGVWPLKFAFVPSANLKEPGELPAPAMHIFYNHRLAKAADDLPKFSGYWSSELAVVRLLMRL